MTFQRNGKTWNRKKELAQDRKHLFVAFILPHGGKSDDDDAYGDDENVA